MRRANFAAAIAIAAVSTAATFAGTVNEYQKLIAPDGGEQELFGSSVAVARSTAVIGAPAAVADTATGAAYTFERSPDRTWAKHQKLIAADGADGDAFGAAVAVDEDTLIVGAPMADDASGAAYVFERRNGDWVEVQKLTTTAESAAFGRSIALQFHTVLIGAPEEHGQIGAIYVFQRNDSGDWEQVQKIPGPAPAEGTVVGGMFGASVAVSRNLGVIGSPAEDGAGAAYIVERGDDGTWHDVLRIFADDGQVGDGFGGAVAVEGYRVLVGADGTDEGAGAAYVFESGVGGEWALAQELTVADPDSVESFGSSVAMTRDTAVVGGDGSAHTFVRDPDYGTWSEREELRSSEGSVAFFGQAVGWDGTTAVVGASRDDQNGLASGSSFVYRLAPVVNTIFPTVIRARARGIAQIVVLGSDELDVSQIDLTSLKFGPGEAAPVHNLSFSLTRANHVRDVNLDGIPDLSLHFRLREVGIGCGQEAATLTGRTLDGRVIDASGTIQSMACPTPMVPRDRSLRPGR